MSWSGFVRTRDVLDNSDDILLALERVRDALGDDDDGFERLARLTALITKYSPDQPRDARGRFGPGGGSSAKSGLAARIQDFLDSPAVHSVVDRVAVMAHDTVLRKKVLGQAVVMALNFSGGVPLPIDVADQVKNSVYMLATGASVTLGRARDMMKDVVRGLVGVRRSILSRAAGDEDVVLTVLQMVSEALDDDSLFDDGFDRLSLLVDSINIAKYTPDQPRDDHGRFGSGGGSAKEDTSREPPRVGEPFLVYRVGSAASGLEGRNAGNADAVADHLVRVSDFEAPAFTTQVGDTVSAYRVTMTEPPATYQPGVAGAVDQGGVGRRVRTRGHDDAAEVSYSFPSGGRGFTYERVDSVPLSSVKDHLRRAGYGSADDAGKIETARAVRAAFKKVALPVGLERGAAPDQPRDEHGRFSSGGGSRWGGSPVPSRDDQSQSAEALRVWATQISKLQGGRGTASIIRDQGQPYHFDETSFSGSVRTRHACYREAGLAAIGSSDRTYVEGFVDVHGVPVDHAWTVDKSGKVFDPTISGHGGIRGYFGVPFKSDYVSSTAVKTKVWGILSYTNRGILDQDPSEYVAKLLVIKYAPDGPDLLTKRDTDGTQARDDHGRWSSSGGSASTGDEPHATEQRDYAKITDGSGRTASDLLKGSASRDEIENHPALVKAREDSDAVPRTESYPGYGTEEFRNSRMFVAPDGSTIRGYDAASDHLMDVARAYAGEGGVTDAKQAWVVLGPPASGKSTYSEALAREQGAGIVDPDDAKKMFKEFGGGIGANAVHEESSLLSGSVLQRFTETGGNVILPKVGAGAASISKLTDSLMEAGYDVHLRVIKTTEEGAYRRGVSRFLNTGRLISGKYITDVDSKPDRVFKDLSASGKYKSTETYDFDANMRP